MRISDWSSDVCSSDLYTIPAPRGSRAGCAPAQVEKWGRARRAGSKKWAARGGPSWKGGSEGRGGGGNAARSEERRVGKECVVRVDLGGRRIIKKKKREQTS